MARIVYRHPYRADGDYQIYTDLDFWDARRILKDLAVAKRNFGNAPSGDEYPTLVQAQGLSQSGKKRIEQRLKRAIVSPPRHVIVRSMLANKSFEFDPTKYYPGRWSKSRMLHFTYRRLPLQQPALTTAYQTVKLSWIEGKIRVERVQRKEKYDPVVRNKKAAKRRIRVPSCF